MEPSSSGHNADSGREFHAGPPHGAEVAARRAEYWAKRGEEIRAALVESERARFRFGAKVALLCVLGCVIGLVPMAWAMHTTDPEAGRLAWAVGPVLGDTLILVVLIGAWIRWSREDW